jgi:hypothetical protein
MSKVCPFLIVGYPRSKTAWFSNYFSNQGIHCYHELSLDKSTIEMESRLANCHGNSDSGLVFESDWIIRKVNSKQYKILLIDRPKEEIRESLQAAYEIEGIKVKNIDFLVELFNFNLTNIKASIVPDPAYRLDVPYQQVFDRIHQIHEFCTPSVPFDHTRFGILKDLRVTQMIGKRLNEYSKNTLGTDFNDAVDSGLFGSED